MVNWLLLFMQVMPFAFPLALAKAGKSIPAKMAMIAITTRSSIRVNPQLFFLDKLKAARWIVR